MEFKRYKNILIVRLFKDEDLLSSIKVALKESNLKNGVIISGIGMLRDVELKVFKGRGKYANKIFDKDWEVVSFSGNIVKTEDDYVLHIHSAIADHNYRCFAGHLGSARVAVTLELFILDLPVRLYRRIDPETGLAGLFLR